MKIEFENIGEIKRTDIIKAVFVKKEEKPRILIGWFQLYEDEIIFKPSYKIERFRFSTDDLVSILLMLQELKRTKFLLNPENRCNG